MADISFPKRARLLPNPGWLSFVLTAFLGSAALFAGIFFWGNSPRASLPAATDQQDLLNAGFGSCGDNLRVNCVVDGDTFWFRGQKIRIADINTPELNRARCKNERELAGQAKRRLLILLNNGPFSLQLINRDRDRYGRQLRVVTRNGESIGDRLVAEGLARKWRGYRGSWC